MVIEIAASYKALTNSGPFDFDDSVQLPDVYTTASLGFNLTGLGARGMEVPGEYGPEIAVSTLNFPLLLASVNAAFHGGIDFIQLNRNFQLHGGESSALRYHSALLDGVRTAAKIADVISGGGLNIEIPFDEEIGLPAVSGFLRNYKGRKSVSVAVKKSEDFRLLEKFSAAAAANNLNVVALCTNPDLLSDNAVRLAELVDAVQLRSGNIEQARRLRFLFHELSEKTGRNVKLIIELGIVISATLQSANERAALISELSHRQIFDGMPHAVGTVYDVADCVEKWIGMGGADGILFTPASLPTDLASVLKGVVPLLNERAKSA
ncbi:hypothetical protein RQN30_01725 [Arcanobacterium hippocoleae]